MADKKYKPPEIWRLIFGKAHAFGLKDYWAPLSITALAVSRIPSGNPTIL